MASLLSHTVQQLNSKRRRAVELRLTGSTLSVTSTEVGLSAPTVIAAMKAYRIGGWAAVDVKPRGRPGRLSQSQTHPSTQLLEPLLKAAQSEADSPSALWDLAAVHRWASTAHGVEVSVSTVGNWLTQWNLQPESRYRQLRASLPNAAWHEKHDGFIRRARRRGKSVYWVSSRTLPTHPTLAQLFAHSLRGAVTWSLVTSPANTTDYLNFLDSLQQILSGELALVIPSHHLMRAPELQDWIKRHNCDVLVVTDPTDMPGTSPGHPIDYTPPISHQETPVSTRTSQSEPSEPSAPAGAVGQRPMTHLERLEAESIHIMREVAAEAENPVMLYSVGKDSAVMLHLARKAFFPSVPPFPLMHVDTTWKFKAMYEFRDRMVSEIGMELITHVNQEGVAQGVNPFTHGSALHTDIMKTEGLKQALDKHRFDIAFGGARRDEEKSRAKERVFSFRTAQHRWEPKSQRPELWDLYNSRKRQGESIRVFPISNWTELDIWQYIHKESIPIVPLYFSAERPVVERDGMLIMVDDDRMPMRDGEVPQMRRVRFRTLGCYPLTGAVESKAESLTDIIQEMLLTKTSERQGRMIDHDASASMEKKKQEGYF